MDVQSSLKDQIDELAGDKLAAGEVETEEAETFLNSIVVQDVKMMTMKMKKKKRKKKMDRGEVTTPQVSDYCILSVSLSSTSLFFYPPPPDKHPKSRWRFLSESMRFALYALIILIPINESI